MKFLNKQTGKIGEALAQACLENKGYQFLVKNYFTKFGEIDLIMLDGQVLVFVEVKTKIGSDFGTPEDMFTKAKYKKVKRIATLYLDGRDVLCRIDMVAVVLDNNTQLISLNHYPNVYPL